MLIDNYQWRTCFYNALITYHLPKWNSLTKTISDVSFSWNFIIFLHFLHINFYLNILEGCLLYSPNFWITLILKSLTNNSISYRFTTMKVRYIIILYISHTVCCDYIFVVIFLWNYFFVKMKMLNWFLNQNRTLFSIYQSVIERSLSRYIHCSN